MNNIRSARISVAMLLITVLVTACGSSSLQYQPVRTVAYAPAYSPVGVPTPVAPVIHQSKLPDPAMLLGLDTTELESLLGDADLRRGDPPAQVWQYADQDCVLHLFLYEKEGSYMVEHFEARATDGNGGAGNQGAGGQCLAGLMNGSIHRAAN